MVAICRLKKAMSFGEIRLPEPPNNGLGLSLTVPGVMPCRRNSARRFAFFAACSPFIFTPRFGPHQTNEQVRGDVAAPC